MAIFADTDAAITVNSVDLSSWVVSSNLSIEADTVETVAMGDTWVEVKPTFQRASLSLELQQDFAASAVDVSLNALVGTSVAFVYKPTSAAVSATNPSYSGNVVVTEYHPSDQSAGEIASFSVTWPVDGAVTRATA